MHALLQPEVYDYLAVVDLWRLRRASKPCLDACRTALSRKKRPLLAGGAHGEAFELDWSTCRWEPLPALGSASLARQWQQIAATVGGAGSERAVAAAVAAAPAERARGSRRGSIFARLSPLLWEQRDGSTVCAGGVAPWHPRVTCAAPGPALRSSGHLPTLAVERLPPPPPRLPPRACGGERAHARDAPTNAHSSGWQLVEGVELRHRRDGAAVVLRDPPLDVDADADVEGACAMVLGGGTAEEQMWGAFRVCARATSATEEVHMRGPVAVAGGGNAATATTTIAGGVAGRLEAALVQAGPSMRHSRMHFAASRLRSVGRGAVIVAGGSSLDGRPLRCAELLLPRGGKWVSLQARMSRERVGCCGAELPDGRFAVFGGGSNPVVGWHQTAEVLVPAVPRPDDADKFGVEWRPLPPPRAAVGEGGRTVALTAEGQPLKVSRTASELLVIGSVHAWRQYGERTPGVVIMLVSALRSKCGDARSKEEYRWLTLPSPPPKWWRGMSARISVD